MVMFEHWSYLHCFQWFWASWRWDIFCFFTSCPCNCLLVCLVMLVGWCSPWIFPNVSFTFGTGLGRWIDFGGIKRISRRGPWAVEGGRRHWGRLCWYTEKGENPTTKPTDLNFGFVRNTFSFKWLQDIEGLFQMLDYDGGGSLDTDEFCEGLDLRNWWMVIGCDVQISLVEASWELQLVRSHWSSLVWWSNALIFWSYVTWIQKGSWFKSRLMIWWRKNI